jgi:hypothetical protein
MYRELTYLISSDNGNSNGNSTGNSTDNSNGNGESKNNGNRDGKGKESSPRWARRPLNKPSTTHQRYIQPKLRRTLRNSRRLEMNIAFLRWIRDESITFLQRPREQGIGFLQRIRDELVKNYHYFLYKLHIGR